MFEEQTYSSVLDRMKKGVENGIDTREGSVMHNALAPAALELSYLYDLLKIILRETYADTASREYLILRAAERGITPNPATYAEIKATITGDNLVASQLINARFACDSVFYTVIEAIENEENTYRLKCNTAGTVGNIPAGFLSNEDYISGVETAQIVSILAYGEDEEETEAFRARYKESLSAQPFAGNVSAYKEMMKTFDNVGNCKIVPAWKSESENGEVEIVVLSSALTAPTDEEIAELQNIVCPNGGDGTGLVPIGHNVTISKAEGKWLIVNFNESGRIDTSDFVSYADIRESLKKVFEEYAKEWEDRRNEDFMIFLSRFIAALQNIKGVYGHSGLMIHRLDNPEDKELDSNGNPKEQLELGWREYIYYEPTPDDLRKLVASLKVTQGGVEKTLEEAVKSSDSNAELKIKITNDDNGNYRIYPYLCRKKFHTKDVIIKKPSNSTIETVTLTGHQSAYKTLKSALGGSVINELNSETNFYNGNKVGYGALSIGQSGVVLDFDSINNKSLGETLRFGVNGLHSDFTQETSKYITSGYDYYETIPISIVSTRSAIGSFVYSQFKQTFDVVRDAIDTFDEEFRNKWLNDVDPNKKIIFSLDELGIACKKAVSGLIRGPWERMTICFNQAVLNSSSFDFDYEIDYKNKTLKLPLNCIPCISYNIYHYVDDYEKTDWYNNGILI